MEIEEFVKSIDGLSTNTKKGYQQTLLQLHDKMAGEEPTTDEIKDFLQHYKKANSLQRHKAAIKAYLEYRWPEKRWPFGRHQFPAVKQMIPRYVPVEQIPDLIAAAGNLDDSMFLETTFTLGGRIHEIMSITPESIVPAGVNVIGKGGEEQLIPTTRAFNTRLQAYAEGRTGRIFPKSYTYYDLLIKRAGAAIGIKKISLHYLRHSRAIDALDKGLEPAYVQQLLRHKNFATTAVYLQITGGKLGSELEKVEATDNGGKQK